MRFNFYLQKCLQNDEFKKEWDLLNPQDEHSDKKAATEIEFYEDKASCPVFDFIEFTLNSNLKAKVQTLRNIDTLPGFTLVKYINDGIYELRDKQDLNSFYFFVFGNKLILTNAHIGKDEDAELRIAKRYMNTYLKKSINKNK